MTFYPWCLMVTKILILSNCSHVVLAQPNEILGHLLTFTSFKCELVRCLCIAMISIYHMSRLCFNKTQKCVFYLLAGMIVEPTTNVQTPYLCIILLYFCIKREK
jgi:hypothetical protein